MAELIGRLSRGYKIVFEEWADDKTKDWFLVAKPYQGLLLLGLYLMFVLKWGPRWMQKRPAFDLYWILILYNVIQIYLCARVFINGQRFWGWGGSYRWICQPVDHSHSEEALFVSNVVYDYFLLKVIDLLDTVFFVLRKKSNQVSFLHVYHHTGMVMLIWGAVTYLPGGHGTSVGVVNSFVHVVMYSYYLLSILKPSITRVMWIKKFVTQLQIVQFLFFVLHIGVIAFIPNCAYPRWTAALFLPQNLFMLILFIDFYIKTYIKKPKSKTDHRDSDDKDNSSKSNGHFSNGDSNKNGLVKESQNGKMQHFIRNHSGSTVTERSIDRAQ